MARPAGAAAAVANWTAAPRRPPLQKVAESGPKVAKVAAFSPGFRRLLPPGVLAGAEVGLGPGAEQHVVGLIHVGVRQRQGLRAGGSGGRG